MLIVITYPFTLRKEIFWIIELFNNGLDILHLRKPKSNIQQIRTYLQKIPYEYHRNIVLHNHFELTKDFSLKGIHLNEENKNNYLFLKDKYKIISASTHNLKDAYIWSSKLDYVFLSPVFNSISKPIFKGKSFKIGKNYNNIVALAGVKKKNINIAYKLGFAHIAVLGSIWQNKHPLQAYKELHKCHYQLLQKKNVP